MFQPIDFWAIFQVYSMRKRKETSVEPNRQEKLSINIFIGLVYFHSVRFIKCLGESKLSRRQGKPIEYQLCKENHSVEIYASLTG